MSDTPRIHLRRPDVGSEVAYCGAEGVTMVTRSQAYDELEPHFTCGACHAALTGGQRHATPPADGGEHG